MGQAKDKEQNFEKYVEGLKKNYHYIFIYPFHFVALLL